MKVKNKRCYNCRELDKDFKTPTTYLCNDCIARGEVMRPVACHGLSDGCGSGVNEINFNRPDVKKEVANVARVMEENGSFKKNPELKTFLEHKLKKLKEAPDPPKIDYQKDGHPAFNKAVEYD